MKKTLGGDRLGAGKKMQVELHGFGRSTHDKSRVFRSSMAAGTLIPCFVEVGLPGDTWTIKINAEIMTHPTIGPLFASSKVQIDVFEAPMRLYQGQLHNNKTGIGNRMQEVKLPQMRLLAKYVPPDHPDPDNAQVNPSCLLSYLGIRGIGSIPESEVGSAERLFNATSLITYWDIVKNYYTNKQEEIGAVIHTGRTAVVETVDTVEWNGTQVTEDGTDDGIVPINGQMVTIGFIGATPNPAEIMFITNIGPISMAELVPSITYGVGIMEGPFVDIWTDLVINGWRYASGTEIIIGPPRVETFPLAALDEMREALQQNFSSAPTIINDLEINPYNWLIQPDTSDPLVPLTNYLNTQEGLAVKTYQSDLFNAWLNTEWIDGPTGVNQRTAISTAGNKFTIDALNIGKKVFDILNRIVASGNTYDDWMDAVWATERMRRVESPIYHGGLIKELVFQQVVSNAQSEDQPLGTLAGRGVMANKHKGGTVVIRVQEPSYIMAMISITPRIDYSQGNEWDTQLKTMDDLHKPGLDEIGFQELITEQMAWWDTYYNAGTASWVRKSAGKQPAWINYMTSVNRTYGNFAIKDNEMFMTQNRRYEFEKAAGDSVPTIADLTTYIDPAKFNFIFAETALDAQNYWAQVAFDVDVRRVMSAKLMPNL